MLGMIGLYEEMGPNLSAYPADNLTLELISFLGLYEKKVLKSNGVETSAFKVSI